MLQAMLSGVASIKAHQTRINVIGDNLANVNTTAFKGSRVTFEDMMAQTLQGGTAANGTQGGTNAKQVGLGVMVGATDINGEQGSMNATNRPSDMAITGNGFFLVKTGDKTQYTRDGAFNLNSSGDLVHSSTGARLMGWQADALGKVDMSVSPSSPLNIPLGSTSAVQATTQVKLGGNLNSKATGTDSWSTQVRVYDQSGAAHDLTVKFTNRTAPATGGPAGAASSWDWDVSEAGVSVGSSATAGNSKVFFDASGKSIAPTTASKVTVAGATMDFDFGQTTGLASASQVTLRDQNGFPPGSLEGYSIGTDGVITGQFSNGLTRALGQVAVATFTNPAGMTRSAGNLWDPSVNSGTASVGAPDSNGRGAINAGYLEQSNVDISQEFTDLIVTQRGFQANTKIVTTVDEMLQELISIKR